MLLFLRSPARSGRDVWSALHWTASSFSSSFSFEYSSMWARFNQPLLALLLLADALFIALNVIQLNFSRFADPRLALSTDRGFAEIFQYVKEYWICCLLVAVAVRRRRSLFAAWAAVFGYLLADDALMVHERIGENLSVQFGLTPVFGIRTQDIGELIVTATSACLLLVPVAVTHLRADSGARRDSWTLAAMLAALATVGVGVDVVHELIREDTWYHIVSIVEDGGEMVVMSFITALTLVTAERAWSEAP